MWITEGDLVETLYTSGGKESEEKYPGIVLKQELAWPADDRDGTLTVTVLHADGVTTKWYDWQLRIINESR